MSVKNKGEIFKCAECGNIVEVLTVGGAALVCCGKPMNLVVANTVDASKEKHVPVLTTGSEGDVVKVGSVPHPMEEKHFIEWIAIKTSDNKVGRKFLKPGDAPEAVFYVPGQVIVEVSEYCNVHGLWKTEVKK